MFIQIFRNTSNKLWNTTVVRIFKMWVTAYKYVFTYLSVFVFSFLLGVGASWCWKHIQSKTKSLWHQRFCLYDGKYFVSFLRQSGPCYHKKILPLPDRFPWLCIKTTIIWKTICIRRFMLTIWKLPSLPDCCCWPWLKWFIHYWWLMTVLWHVH